MFVLIDEVESLTSARKVGLTHALMGCRDRQGGVRLRSADLDPNSPGVFTRTHERAVLRAPKPDCRSRARRRAPPASRPRAAPQAAVSGSEPSDAIRAVNALLTQLDALRRHPNVMVLTTSNITEAIDLAFVDRADIKVGGLGWLCACKRVCVCVCDKVCV